MSSKSALPTWGEWSDDKTEIKNNKNYPTPCGYRILIELPKVQEKSSGGILLPEQALDPQRHLAQIGRVVSVGPEAYRPTPSRDFAGSWCKIGDYVMFSKYAGTRMMIDGIELRLINDDAVQAVVPNPSAVKSAS